MKQPSPTHCQWAIITLSDHHKLHALTLGEAESVAKAPNLSALLQRLRQHLVLSEDVAGHWAPRELHGVLRSVASWFPALGPHLPPCRRLCLCGRTTELAALRKSAPILRNSQNHVNKYSKTTPRHILLELELPYPPSWSRIKSVSIACQIGNLPARWQLSVRSAPEKPFVDLASYFRSTSMCVRLMRKHALRVARGSSHRAAEWRCAGRVCQVAGWRNRWCPADCWWRRRWTSHPSPSKPSRVWVLRTLLFKASI